MVSFMKFVRINRLLRLITHKDYKTKLSLTGLRLSNHSSKLKLYLLNLINKSNPVWIV